MARSTPKQAKSKGKGKKPSYDAPNSDSDLGSRLAMDINTTLDKSYKQKSKKPPAPRDGADSSGSESEPSDDELAQLRAENARLRAEFQHRSKEVANDPVAAVPASGTTPVQTTRIPPPDTKTKINAKKWRKMLGWEESKVPWLQCRAYTRRAISRAPLDLMRPWKQQDLADLTSAVALLVKRVPELERFEKNWGALQLIQETFNHMRATFLANELSSGSENDNYIRKKRKKESALKTAKEEHESGKGEHKSSKEEHLSSDEEHLGNDLSDEEPALEKNTGSKPRELGSPTPRPPSPPLQAHGTSPCVSSPPPPEGVHAHKPALPDGTRTLESLWTRASSKAKSGQVPKPVRPIGGHPPKPAQPDDPPTPQLPQTNRPTGDYAPGSATPGDVRNLKPPIANSPPSDAPSRLPSQLSTPELPLNDFSADEPTEEDASPASNDHGPLDVSVRSTTAAAALAAINNGVPVPDKSRARTTKKPAPANVSKDNASLPEPAAAVVTAPGPKRGRDQDQGEPISSKPKSPRLPAREALPRKSKLQAKQPPATPAPKGKKRKAEQSDETGGNKRTKKGESRATSRDPNGAKADTNEPARGLDPGEEKDGEDWLMPPPLLYLPQEPPSISPQFDAPELDEELEVDLLAEGDNLDGA